MEKMVFIPGPTPVVASIREEMGREIQAFGDPRFVADYKGLIDGMGQLVNCAGKTFVIAGTGTLAMEMAIANSTRRGDKVLLVSHGFFGDRFIEICERKGISLDVLRCPWGQTVPLEEIQAQLQKQDYAAILVTHVDTSTGVAADLNAIGSLSQNHPDTLFIVDGVCATGAEPEDMQAMGIDLLFTGSQKALGVCPGMLLLWAGPKALARRESLGTIPEYYIDYQKWLPVMNDPRKYFATPAINLVWALAESLRLINTEGVPERYARHRKHARALQAALQALGFGILADENHRAVTLSNVLYPEGIEDAAFRAELYEQGVIVAGGLGPTAGKLFRLGHMGNITARELEEVLEAIERTLIKLNHLVKPGKGVQTFKEQIATTRLSPTSENRTRNIVLISCVKTKVSHRAKAKDLYTSARFRYSLEYARTLKPDAIYVLSALYGLLELDQVVDTYDFTLVGKSESFKQEWADQVLRVLKTKTDLKRDHFIVLASNNYRKYLLDEMESFEIPMEHLNQGQQLQFLKERISL